MFYFWKSVEISINRRKKRKRYHSCISAEVIVLPRRVQFYVSKRTPQAVSKDTSTKSNVPMLHPIGRILKRILCVDEEGDSGAVLFTKSNAFLRARGTWVFERLQCNLGSASVMSQVRDGVCQQESYPASCLGTEASPTDKPGVGEECKFMWIFSGIFYEEWKSTQ